MSVFTDLANKLRDVAPEISAVLEVADAAAAALGMAGTDAAVKIVEAAFNAFAAHRAGAMTHDDFINQIAEYQQDLAAARAGEDAELDALDAPPTSTGPVTAG